MYKIKNTRLFSESRISIYTKYFIVPHKEYYPRFGYRKAIDLGIEFPFEVSHEYCMVAELIPGATENVKGMVCYPTDFK